MTGAYFLLFTLRPFPRVFFFKSWRNVYVYLHVVGSSCIPDQFFDTAEYDIFPHHPPVLFDPTQLLFLLANVFDLVRSCRILVDLVTSRVYSGPGDCGTSLVTHDKRNGF